MLVLASARDLILLFLAFELMSIPLYVLAGFSRARRYVEASLKFFLVGSVSSAVLAYGLSFVYGATGTTDLARSPQPRPPPAPAHARLGRRAGRVRVQDRRLPVSHVGADTYEARRRPSWPG
jgi:formate hydrogenlyase subunit 3/multisubunit Na+/H+ antiporter MnhD subunit